jgi:hypothetical protein
MRDCSSCAGFAAMIPSRSADLRALAPPLPAIAAAGLLTRVIGGSSAGGGSVGLGGGGAGLAGTLTGKTVTAGLLSKAVAGALIVSAASFGITSAVEHKTAVHHHSAAVPLVVPDTAAGAATNRAFGTQRSQTPGAPSASHRTNAAAAAAFGQQTSQTARYGVHGNSALAPRGLTVVRPVVTTPTHPTTPSSNAPSHGTGSSGSSVGSTVSSTKSQQGQAPSLLHTSTVSAAVAPRQSTRTVTTLKGLIPPGL